jgi:hypothetical protein
MYSSESWLSIGFIALAGIKMLKNLKKLLIIISRNDAYVKIMEFPFLKYSTTKNQKSLFQKGYKKLRNSLIKYLKGLISCNCNVIIHVNLRLNYRFYECIMLVECYMYQPEFYCAYIFVFSHLGVSCDFSSVITKKFLEICRSFPKINDNPLMRKFYGFIFQIEPSKTIIQIPKLNFIHIFAFSVSLLREKIWGLNANILLRLTFTK